MSIEEMAARAFHEAYERAAPSFGYETRAETRAFDPTSANGRLMIAVCAEIIGPWRARLAAAERERDNAMLNLIADTAPSEEPEK